MTTTQVAPVAEIKEKAKKAPPVKAEPSNFVTQEQFSQVTDILKDIVSSMTELKNKPSAPVAESKDLQDIAKAKYDQAPINPLWEEKAREIIGEALDHCEVFYPKQGGQIFTVVIKTEMSNAPKEYLERTKADRRSREIGNEGIAGVEQWCKLIKANLKRAR